MDSLVSNLFNRFVSQEETVQVSGRIGTSSPDDSKIVQTNLERDLNAIVPAIMFSAGAEEYAVTFDDIVSKLETLGCDTAGIRTWIAEQPFNYTPPVDFDKFINFSNYRWIGDPENDDAPVWNADLNPEYYVIARPRATESQKWPVVAATTRNVHMWANDRPTETITITFTSANDFTVTSDIDTTLSALPLTLDVGQQTQVILKSTDPGPNDLGTNPSIGLAASTVYDVAQLTVIKGIVPFEAGDQIVITMTHFTTNFTVETISANLSGKGVASGIMTLTPNMSIDGVQLQVGNRILVKDQIDPTENGIYVFSVGAEWAKSTDADTPAELLDGSTVYVLDGTVSGGNIFTYDLSYNEFLDPTPSAYPFNDWQRYNYWVHMDDLGDYPSQVESAIRATRPIIEYDSRLQLNSYVLDGVPTSSNIDGATSVPQVKTAFNQLPLFDLFRYDGTHSGLVSSIWYYVEDPSYEVDDILLRRVKTNEDSDFVFGAGIKDAAGRLLYFKIGSELHNVWRAGPSAAYASTPVLVGNGTLGTVVIDDIVEDADQQTYDATFTDSTNFVLFGSRSGDLGLGVVGVEKDFGDGKLTIVSGAYSANDVINFNVYNKTAPRYVVKADDGTVINYPGGYAADQTNTEPLGTYLTPGRMFKNLFRETRTEVSYGDFINHARSVIRWQNGIEGSDVGSNTARMLDFDGGLGGYISDFGSNYQLFSSMMAEQDMSPLTILAFGEQQYNVALSSIDTLILQDFAKYASTYGVITVTGDTEADASSADIAELEAYAEGERAKNSLLTTVFSDTTAIVKNWPATLPMLGLWPASEPMVDVDHEENLLVMVHHDGHTSPLMTADASLNRNIALAKITRSDGAIVPGTVSVSMPSSVPYAGQLWYSDTTNILKQFVAKYDTVTQPVDPVAGDVWFKRDLAEFHVFSGTVWNLDHVGVNVNDWITIDVSAIRNALLLSIERKLYASVHEYQQLSLDLQSVNTPDNELLLDRELAEFAGKYKIDRFAPIFNSSNPFTWNYSQAVVPELVDSYARWYTLYKAYTATFVGDTLATDRPDLEPWRLGTGLFAPSMEKPAGWDAQYASTVSPTSTLAYVRAVSTTAVGSLSGLPTVDGMTLSSGDKVLLTAQTVLPYQNGLWIVRPGSWYRALDTLQSGLTVNVMDGTYRDTQWVLTTGGPIVVESTPLTFVQARTWLSTMWDDIKAFHPTIKLLVNVANDQLLPPYVAAGSDPLNNALMHTMPAGISDPYAMGDLGPIELSWTKSIEYRYSLAKIYFRLYPLEFLDRSWGDTYVIANSLSIRVERDLGTSLPHTKFKLHGEKVENPAVAETYVVPFTTTVMVLDNGSLQAGFGYADGLYADFDLIGGSGTGAKASILVAGGSVTVVNPTTFGSNYEVGDVLTALIPDGTGFSIEISEYVQTVPTVGSPTSIKLRGVDENAAYSPIQWGDLFASTVVFRATHLASTGDEAQSPVDPAEVLSISATQVEMGPSATVFSVLIDDVSIGYVLEGVPFSFTYGSGDTGVSFTNMVIDDLGLPFNLGDAIVVQFNANETVTTNIPLNTDYNYGELGCEGCIAITHEDEIVVTSSTRKSPTYTFTPSIVKKYKGLCQLFTNLLRFNFIDEDMSGVIMAYRGWDVKMIHRLGSLIRPDSLNIEVTSGLLPASAYRLMLKRSVKTDSKWFTGLRVQVVQVGSAINRNGAYIPNGAASDWIFRVEGYNLNNLVVDYDTYGSKYNGFKALSGETTDLEWKRPVEPTGTTTAVLPMTITGLQNVINFVFGYADQLAELGFKPNAIDSATIDVSTGRNIDWQLEVEKLIDSIYQGTLAGAGVILNPYLNKLYLATPFGIMGRYDKAKSVDITSVQACFDIDGQMIPVTSLGIIRNDDYSITVCDTPIFSAHLFTDTFEHALVFNSRFTNDPTSPAMFDLFLGQHVTTAYLSYRRQAQVDGKPRLDGFFLSGNDAIRNPVSNIDSLNQVYDPTLTFDNPLMAKHALSLVGFKSKDYFDDLGITENVQLNFWQGMINAKGTDLSINTFINYKTFVSAGIDEFWAYKVADYGDAREKSMPELKIEPKDCSNKFTSIKTYEEGDTLVPKIVNVEINDPNRWYSIDDLGTSLTFEAVSISEEVEVQPGEYKKLKNVYHRDATVAPTSSDSSKAIVVGADLVKGVAGGTVTVTGWTWINRTNISPVKLYNYVDKDLVADIGMWHPAANVHALEPLSIVDVIVKSDPANYNHTTQTVDNPNFLHLKPWGKEEVGRTWWDTSTRSYMPYYDGSVFQTSADRQIRWGALNEFASVDLYEWIESPVHPSEYNALAAEQEGDASITQNQRLSGTVGFTNLYRSDRTVSVRPIAWSQKSTGNASHPDWEGWATFNQIFNAGESDEYFLIIGSGRAVDLGMTAGRHFSSMEDETTPLSEVVLNGTLRYVVGTAANPTADGAAAPTPSMGILDFWLQETAGSSQFGTIIGEIMLSDSSYQLPSDVNTNYRLRLSDSNGFFEDVLIGDWDGDNEKMVVKFEKFGLELVLVQDGVTDPITATNIISAIVLPANDFFVREAVDYTPIVAIGDLVDPDEIEGWVVFDVPSQADLDDDLRSPNNKWLPYLGAPVAVAITPEIAKEMNAATNTLTTSNGVSVSRYTSTWSDWGKLVDTVVDLYVGSDESWNFSRDLTAELTEIGETELDTTRLSVYANGIQQPPIGLDVVGNVVSLINPLPVLAGAGVYRIHILYRKYQPKDDELAFDPDVEEDYKIQVKYKEDYQYTEIKSRDASGSQVSSKYYFWAKDKKIPRINKSMSLVDAERYLSRGMDQYMILDGINIV